MAMPDQEPSMSTPLLPKLISASDEEAAVSTLSPHFAASPMPQDSYKALAVLPGHVGSVSCLALCGEFVLSASRGTDIVAWQQPDLRRFARFGHGEGSVKALAAAGSRVFSAHQDGRVRVWRLSRRSENAFKLVAALPTTKDYLGKFLKQSNYVQTRRNHRRLWIEHGDSISCLAVHGGAVYSGSWDKTLKVWRMSDLKCLESIRAHDDAINAIAAHDGIVYSASADGRIKAWEKGKSSHCLKDVLVARDGVSWNAVAVSDGGGRWVYGAGSDGSVVGWDRQGKGGAWRLVCDVKAHGMAVLCLCTVGDLLCTGSADKTIGVWRRERGGVLGKVGAIRGHEGPVKCLQASWCRVGRGYMLYSGGLDKSLRVWWVPKGWSEGGSGSEQQERGMQRCCVLLR